MNGRITMVQRKIKRNLSFWDGRDGINRMAESHITEIRDGSRLIPKDMVYAYDSFGRRILEGDILNRWARHTEYRGLTMDVWKNAAVHGIKEPRESRGIDSMGMKFTELGDFLPAFADFSRASPYDFTHVALTLPLTAGGEVLGLLRTEHSGINFNPFVSAGHKDAERHYFGKDHLGSVRAVTNQWGSPLYMFDYDVFGTPLQDRPERFHYAFTGKEYDGWTGLYNYGFRDYAPVLGRFTTVDPIQDGHNWYAYVNSDPVNWLDPWGLEPCKQESGEDKKQETGRVINKTGDIILIKPEHDDTPYTLLKPGEIYEGNIDGIIFADGTVRKTYGKSKYVAKQTRSGKYKVSGGKLVDSFINLGKAERNILYTKLKLQGVDPSSVGMRWEDAYSTYHYGIDKHDFLVSWVNTEKKLDVNNDGDADTSFVPIPFSISNLVLPKQYILDQWRRLALYEGR